MLDPAVGSDVIAGAARGRILNVAVRPAAAPGRDIFRRSGAVVVRWNVVAAVPSAVLIAAAWSPTPKPRSVFRVAPRSIQRLVSTPSSTMTRSPCGPLVGWKMSQDAGSGPGDATRTGIRAPVGGLRPPRVVMPMRSGNRRSAVTASVVTGVAGVAGRAETAGGATRPRRSASGARKAAIIGNGSRQQQGADHGPGSFGSEQQRTKTARGSPRAVNLFVRSATGPGGKDLVFLRRQNLTAAIGAGLQVDVVRTALQLAGVLVLDIDDSRSPGRRGRGACCDARGILCASERPCPSQSSKSGAAQSRSLSGAKTIAAAHRDRHARARLMHELGATISRQFKRASARRMPDLGADSPDRPATGP